MNDHQHTHDDHEHGHDHGHTHSAGHSHAPATFGRAFAIGTALNAAFVLVEIVFGISSQSVALIADAGHNLADVLGLIAAWVAHDLSRRPPTPQFTWGYRGSSIVAALFNAALLFVGAGAIGWEALQRLLHPEPVAGATVMAVAALGILVNGGTALLFASGRKGDLNIRGAYLHMAVDAAVSLAVLVSGLLVLVTGWQWIDPLVGLLVVVVIVRGTWSLFTDSLSMSLAAVPRGVRAGAVRAYLADRPGVSALHDLHIWPVGTADVALSAHLVMPGGHPGDAFLLTICDALRNRFGIGHTTIQIETDASTVCPHEAEDAL
jgi:cobalt-zinc-cadmium efflux system protein